MEMVIKQKWMWNNLFCVLFAQMSLENNIKQLSAGSCRQNVYSLHDENKKEIEADELGLPLYVI